MPAKLQPKQRFALIILATGTTAAIIAAISNAVKKAKARKTQEDLLNLYNSSQQIGDTEGMTAAKIAMKATVIYDAFYNNDVLGFTEDEDRAIDTLLSVPVKYVPFIASAYFKLYEKILQEDFVKFLRSDQWDRVKHYFNE